MFPLSFPLKQLRGLGPNEWVLDPFCGRGTTNFAARLLGIPSVGVDSSPIATAIAKGKMAETSAEAIVKACSDILNDSKEIAPPDGEFWKLCYHPQTLQDIMNLRAAFLQECKAPERIALRALVLGILHGPRNKGIPGYLSNQMPRTFSSKPDYSVHYWQKNNLLPVYIDVKELVKRKIAHFFTSELPTVSHSLFCDDSRRFDFASLSLRFSRVITSPPYYGMRTYIPDQWLRYWFMGGPSNVIYRDSNQMSHFSPSEFAEQLAFIWTKIAQVCLPGAKLLIRFGGIHDRKANPKEILLESLRQARPRLRVLTVRSAGFASSGKRQADQFRRILRNPMEEFDFYVRVGGVK